MPYALEITGKDIGAIEALHGLLPAGTEINIAFLGNESHDQRIRVAELIRQAGYEPVPIISSRRLTSVADGDRLIAGYLAAAAPARFMFVGGDPKAPAGPYRDSLALLGSEVLARHGITRVKIAGYPEGHPRIAPELLWQALRWKSAFLSERGVDFEITTQFGFDAEAIVRWITELRQQGIDALVRIGIPGPTSAGKLLRFAGQFGVGASAAILRRYGISLANLLDPVGPEAFLDRLTAAMAGKDLGRTAIHLYPFGGLVDGVAWINGALARGELPIRQG
ncbi:methylenetetrahydrofolate reductase [Paracoccus aminophilus]|uniref:Methylenetetrahydrofolate reductase (NADPH) n=1 Tax=Paracoccus aminophilus JCM 7686 TaxID=1367847 RepID=S5XYS6_PARAH|nr:methylenetetrahydrofolate reductase [Paracoccus aminophilus]AGT08585.1 methylenetetrahydrofolate reductase (NADPH) [Paracoccus aminophilus JCM 7686]